MIIVHGGRSGVGVQSPASQHQIGFPWNPGPMNNGTLGVSTRFPAHYPGLWHPLQHKSLSFSLSARQKTKTKFQTTVASFHRPFVWSANQSISIKNVWIFCGQSGIRPGTGCGYYDLLIYKHFHSDESERSRPEQFYFSTYAGAAHSCWSTLCS